MWPWSSAITLPTDRRAGRGTARSSVLICLVLPTDRCLIAPTHRGRLRWSHIGVAVAVAGRRMKLYDVVDPRISEPPLAAALYSPECVSFMTCNGPFMTVWDACTG